MLRTSDGAQLDTAGHVVVKEDPSSFAVALHDGVEGLRTQAVTWPTHTQSPPSGHYVPLTRSRTRGLQLTHGVDGLGHLMGLNSATPVLVEHHEVLLPAVEGSEQLLELVEAHLAGVISLRGLQLRLNSQRGRETVDTRRGSADITRIHPASQS